MKKSTRLATVLVTAGALGVGGVVAVSPALADVLTGPNATAAGPGPGPGGDSDHGMRGGYGMRDGSGPRNQDGTGAGPAWGMGEGARDRMRDRDGTCDGSAITAEKGTLTEQQQKTLAAMAQEEKLAHDLYAAFADKYQAVIFDRIAVAETRHLDAVRAMLDRYGLSDPTAGQAAGKFSDPAVQATYDRLLAQGSTDQAAALGAGRTVEQTDIADLQKAIEGLTAPDVKQLYTNLLNASRHHLQAFENWSTR